MPVKRAPVSRPDVVPVKAVTPIAQNTQTVNKAVSASRVRGATSSKDILETDYVEIDIRKYRKYYGPVSENFTAMIHGEPGAGKTYNMLEMANNFSNWFGNVLYVSSEEYGSKTLKDKIEEVGANSPNLYFAKDLLRVNIDDFKFLFFDSINHMKMSLKAFQDLKDDYPRIAKILLVQKNKDGSFKGSKDWEHEVDIAAEFTRQGTGNRISRYLRVYKNRFGVINTFKL